MTEAGLRKLLTRHGLSAGRRLGQHYLTSEPVLDRIVGALGLEGGDPVLEVGPGVGTLTARLCAHGARVTAAELDRSLGPALAEVLGGRPGGFAAPGGIGEAFAGGVRVIWGDAVKLPWGALADLEPGPWRLCSNLPYYLTGPFLASFLEGGLPWTSAVLLVQQESADRMMAVPRTKAYGAFTCLVGYYATVERLFPVGRALFYPPPRVDSIVIRLAARPAPPVPAPPAILRRVIRAAFALRRKTLRNALSAGLRLAPATVEAAIAKVGLAPTARGEELGLPEFSELALVLAASEQAP